MKDTVSFFGLIKKQMLKIFNMLKLCTSSVIVVFVLVLLGLKIIQDPRCIAGIITFATNVRQANNIDVTVKDIIKAYPVFNGDNYIVENTKAETEVEKEDVVSDDTAKFDASAVDAVSNIITIDKSEMKVKETKNYTRIDIYGFTIYDYSSKNIDYEELISRNINLTKKSDPVLIYCTHTSETYKNSDNFKFDYTGNYRTKDAKYNMLSVASILSNTLLEGDITSVFDTTAHDYTSYDNSYTNSSKTIKKNLEKYSRFGITIDVHRDAAADLSFAPKTTINGKSTAQLMLVIGVGYDSFKNEYYEENLSLALHIAKLGEEMYPGLFRQVLVRDARYNQHLSPGSILVEVGATGNTLEEAYYGARCFGNILKRLYK